MERPNYSMYAIKSTTSSETISAFVLARMVYIHTTRSWIYSCDKTIALGTGGSDMHCGLVGRLGPQVLKLSSNCWLGSRFW